MGALKTGLKIGVCCKEREAAIMFMDALFNEPDHKRISQYETTYLYDNGDNIAWITPRESVRGRKFDLIFCDESVDDEFKHVVLHCMNVGHYRFYWMLEQFNEKRDVKFELIR